MKIHPSFLMEISKIGFQIQFSHGNLVCLMWCKSHNEIPVGNSPWHFNWIILWELSMLYCVANLGFFSWEILHNIFSYMGFSHANCVRSNSLTISIQKCMLYEVATIHLQFPNDNFL